MDWTGLDWAERGGAGPSAESGTHLRMGRPAQPSGRLKPDEPRGEGQPAQTRQTRG